MAKEIKYGDESRERLKRGVDQAVDAAKVTLGAKGRIVSIRNDFGRNHPTKDGVTVLKNIRLSDPIEDMGASYITEASKEVAEEAGDGTTSTAILAQAIVTEGMKNLAAGANPVDLNIGIGLAVKEVVSFLESMSEEVGDTVKKIRQVATISANNDPEIGNLIADAIDKVGHETVITAEESATTETYVDVIEGLEFDKGYMNPYFVTNPGKMVVEYDNPSIFLLDGKINTMPVAQGLMEYVAKTGNPLVIIANDISGEVLATLALNKSKGGLPIVAVKAPYMAEKRREFIDDIATLTGTIVVSDDSGVGFESFSSDMLGKCNKVVIKKDSTAIIGGEGTKEEVEEKVVELRTRLEDSKDPRDKKFLKSRIAKLSGGVAVMYVGANTESELKEKMDRVDDALAATRAAVEEGIVAGGGTMLIKSLPSINHDLATNQDQRTGMAIIAKAIKAPFLQIMVNAGVTNPEGVLEEVSKGTLNYGYDVKAGVFVDMKDAGIIDPKKVVRVALESAASVASLLLITEATITQDINPQ